MTTPFTTEPPSFQRYLSSKKTVDDRALNKDVWHALQTNMPPQPRILEIGAGIGTMAERLLEKGLIRDGCYTAVDNNPANIQTAQTRLNNLQNNINFQLEAIDLFDFAQREQGVQTWDVLIAHAFLDLMDIEATLPILFSLLKPGGLFYFTINFDGATILEPAIEPEFDTLVERLYHQTMDDRMTNGRFSGDSRSGRHLFTHLRNNNTQILAAGSSDWVIFANPPLPSASSGNDNLGSGNYPADEAYFLHFIIHTMHQALKDHPQLDEGKFNNWITQRHQQIEAGELVYIAHQLDFLGTI